MNKLKAIWSLLWAREWALLCNNSFYGSYKKEDAHTDIRLICEIYEKGIERIRKKSEITPKAQDKEMNDG